MEAAGELTRWPGSARTRCQMPDTRSARCRWEVGPGCSPVHCWAPFHWKRISKETPWKRDTVRAETQLMKMMILLMDRFYRDIAKVARFKHNYSASFGRYTCLYFQLDMSHTIIGPSPYLMERSSTKIPSEMEAVPQHKLFTLCSIFTVHTAYIAYTAYTVCTV